MSIKDLSEMKLESCMQADGALGEYLMKLGIFDLREMTEDQSIEMISKIVEAYNVHLNSLLDDEIPF